MEDPIIFWTLLGLLAVISIFLNPFRRKKHLSICKYDYLEVISFQEWKAGRTIKQELEALHGGYLNYGELYLSLRELTEEGFLDTRDEFDEDGRIRLYRRKHGGRRNEDEETAGLQPLELKLA